MNLEKKKELAARTLGVGKARIVLNLQRLDEIKEAITRQDIQDLVQSKAIFVKEIKGRRKVVKRKTRRRQGSSKIKVRNKKEEYMTITRKLRDFAKALKTKEVINVEEYREIRKKIKSRTFRSKAQLKEGVAEMRKGEK